MDIKGMANYLGLTELEAKMLKERADELGLDPLKGQIFLQKYKKREDEKSEWKVIYVFQIGIEGFRLIAERSEKYLGQDQIMYTVIRNEKEVSTGVVLDDDLPVAATATIYKKGIDRPFVTVAHYRDYVQLKKNTTVPTNMWSKWCIMLAKCAEAAAFRKGFPDLGFSGAYEPAEIGFDQDEDKGGGERQKPPWEEHDLKSRTGDGKPGKNDESGKPGAPEATSAEQKQKQSSEKSNSDDSLKKKDGAKSQNTQGKKSAEGEKKSESGEKGTQQAMIIKTQKDAIIKLAERKGQTFDPVALDDITFKSAAEIIKNLNKMEDAGKKEAA